LGDYRYLVVLLAIHVLLGSVPRVGDLLLLWVIWGIISVEWLLRAVFGGDSLKFHSISRASGCFGEKKCWIWAVSGAVTYTLWLL
jgi:hypothetical protein